MTSPRNDFKFDVFLSHPGSDKEPYVLPLARKLRAEDIRPWLDVWDLDPTPPWTEGLAKGVKDSATFAICIGENGLGKWESQELNLALVRSANEKQFRLIPVLLPGVPDDFKPESLPPFLTTRTWVDFRKGIDDKRALHCLVCAIKGEPPGPEDDPIEAETISAPDRGVCPYLGLRVFKENDAKFFFGRDNDIQQLVEKLKSTRFLAVLGASGSGKSSLVRAGLIPALRNGKRLTGSNTWSVVPTFHPDTSPLGSLASYFAELPNANTNGLLTQLREDDKSLHTAVRKYLDSTSHGETNPQHVLIVVDQLEEVFTLCKDDHDRKQFLANLLYAGTVPYGGCVVVLTMRADFYPKCATYSEFSKALAANQYLVSPMEYEGLLQAIEAPAKRASAEFESGLVKAIADDVKNQPGALPLLAHALLELWNRQKNGVIKLEDYIDIGKVQGAIAKRADAIYESFTPQEQTITKRIMRRLTQPGKGTEDTIRRASRDELITNSDEKEAVDRVIETLTNPDNRLLTTDRQTGTPYIQVSHEALIRGWGMLRVWLDEDREGLHLHRRLTEAAKEWEEHKEEEEFLYHGLRLSEAVLWREEYEFELSELERTFLNKSEALRQSIQEKEQEREMEVARIQAVAIQNLATQRRKALPGQHYITISLAVTLIAIVAFRSCIFRQYEDSRSRSLAAKAAVVQSTNVDLSILLASEAARISQTPEAEDALRNSLIESLGLREVPVGHKDLMADPHFSPNGESVVTTSYDNIAHIWDVASGRLLQGLKDPSLSVQNALFGPDGKLVVTVSSDKTARIWEVNLGRSSQGSKDHTGNVSSAVTQCRLSQELKGHTESVSSAVFSPDGKSVVTASYDKSARVWDVTTGRLLQELKGHTDRVVSAVFSPDGKSVVTASGDHTARIWDVTSGRLLRELKGHTDSVSSAVFSPDGKSVVTASDDETVRLWDVASGRLLRELKGHALNIRGAVFSLDGKSVITTSYDKTTRIWDVASGWLLQELKGRFIYVPRVVPSLDPNSVVPASSDNTVRIWNREQLGDLKSLLELAKKKVPRELTVEERKKYLEH